MKRMLKKLTVLVTVLVVMLGISGCDKKDVDSNNKIVIGYDNTYFPMGYLDDKGNTVGFDVDLAKETFKRLNIDIEFQSIDWSMKETELNSGNIDAIWNGYSLTEERKKKVSFVIFSLELI